MKKVLTAAIIASLAAGSALAADKGEIELAYVEWSTEIASTNVVRAVLEQAGYDVKTTSLSAAAMFQAVAAGDADGMVAAWLPSTHASYYEKLGSKMDNLGANLHGTKLGLVVPSYTYDKVKSIADIKAQGELFGEQITGIDPGAGIMSMAEKAIDEYDLDDIRLRSGSGATMTAALDAAIKNNEDIVVTGWTPHWMFARYDLNYLEDPKASFGGAEEIVTLVRKGLKEDKPEAYAILDRFEWTPDDMNEVMLMNQEEGSDPYENAKKWVAEHPDKVNAWLGK